MEQQTPTTQKTDRGCMLTGILLLSLLGAVIGILFGAGGAYGCIERKEFSNIHMWISIIVLLANLYALYAIFKTFKMEKKGAKGLLAAIAVNFLFFLYVAFSKTPTTDEEKSGAGSALLFAIICIVAAIIIGLHMKRMK